MDGHDDSPEDLRLRIEALERLVRDERRLRDAAERKAADQATKTRRWRERSEARTERITRLEADRDRLKAQRAALREEVRRRRLVPGVLLRKPARSTTQPAPGNEPEQVAPPVVVDPPPVEAPETTVVDTAPAPVAARRPAIPTVQAGTVVDDPALRLLVAETTNLDLAVDPSGFFESDVLVVEAAALQRSTPDLRDAFAEWVGLDARQPLVWISDNPADTPAGATLRVGRGALELPATFDPAHHTPVGRPGVVRDTTAMTTSDFDPRDPGSVAEAARAVPRAGAPDPVAAGDWLRRRVWAEQAPAALMRRVVNATGLSYEDPTPEVTALVVSNRPDDLRRQIVAITAQDHPRLRVAVGCHGFSSREVVDALAVATERRPTVVHDLPAGETLGWCLNRVVESVGSAVVAKIDDDDHYGPGYLTDALQAMDYSGAGVIGRVASFTYLEGEDRTILRRLGDEEMYYDGTLIGATLVFDRSIWERSPFPHKTLAEDVGLQRGARALGKRVYVASRWDFVYHRRVSGNTWRVPDEHFLAHHADAWPGWHPEQADLERVMGS